MRLRSGRSVHVPVLPYQKRARRARPTTGGNAIQSTAGGQAPGATNVIDPTEGDGLAPEEPATNFTYSPVDAWNPTPQEEQPPQPGVELVSVAAPANPPQGREQSTALSPTAIARQKTLEKRDRTPIIEFVAEAPPEKKQKVATHGKIRVPLNDAEATWEAQEKRDFIAQTPMNLTHGNRYVRRKELDKLVWAAPGVQSYDEMFVTSPTSPWLVPDADWPGESIYHMFRERRPSHRPAPTRYEREFLAKETQVPWMKPSVTFEFEQARYESEEQPRTTKARERDGEPVSPSHKPTAEEMSSEEFKTFADTLSSPELDS